MTEYSADVIVIGGGVGGVAAALAAAEMGASVIVCEATPWIGGQLTSQAVPPDENQWIETFGGTRRYRQFRHRVRQYYRRNFHLSESALAQPDFNPGNGTVSRLCHEPRVALTVLYEMLAPHLKAGRIRILLECRPLAAETERDMVRAVTCVRATDWERITLHGAFFVDASELGDLLPLTGTEYISGAEAQAQTGELHAASTADALNMQAISVVFALDYRPGEDHTVERPAAYEFWRTYTPAVRPAWTGRLFSWTYPTPASLAPRTQTLFGGQDHPSATDASGVSLWHYRRIVDRTNFAPGTYTSDITLVNWPQTDYFLGPIIEVPPEQAQAHLTAARELSLSYLYWMQTEAPRIDGHTGYPGLCLRPDVVGSHDGLALFPYIREGRRIRARFTVTEEHVGKALRGSQYAAEFPDSVGIGHYNIDLHPTCAGDNYVDIPTLPFQIPLGSLIPIRIRNLLPAAKNIGTTHVTNGCYRLHPVEWNIGEAVGHLVGFCLQRQLMPETVHYRPAILQEYQGLLTRVGIELRWPQLSGPA